MMAGDAIEVPGDVKIAQNGKPEPIFVDIHFSVTVTARGRIKVNIPPIGDYGPGEFGPFTTLLTVPSGCADVAATRQDAVTLDERGRQRPKTRAEAR
jgi:hypothetical protein